MISSLLQPVYISGVHSEWIDGVEYNSDTCGQFCYCRVSIDDEFYNVETKELCRFAEQIGYRVEVTVRIKGNVLKSIYLSKLNEKFPN